VAGNYSLKDLPVVYTAVGYHLRCRDHGSTLISRMMMPRCIQVVAAFGLE
jgi:hypothetical protein